MRKASPGRFLGSEYHPYLPIIVLLLACVATNVAQTNRTTVKEAPPVSDKQINVNWLYGSYVPKDIALQPLDRHKRFDLYIRQTYTTSGIYIKTTLFALHDQITNKEPEWGSGFTGFAKRLGNRQIQFIFQNSVTSLGDGMLRWEPRYDRCRCDGFWPRTRHAIVRNFVTYGRNERSLRPQVMPYLGAFGASALATTWEPGHSSWQVQGYQGAITQVFVGAGINWIGEFAPEIVRVIHRKKSAARQSVLGVARTNVHANTTRQ